MDNFIVFMGIHILKSLEDRSGYGFDFFFGQIFIFLNVGGEVWAFAELKDAGKGVFV